MKDAILESGAVAKDGSGGTIPHSLHPGCESSPEVGVQKVDNTHTHTHMLITNGVHAVYAVGCSASRESEALLQGGQGGVSQVLW